LIGNGRLKAFTPTILVPPRRSMTGQPKRRRRVSAASKRWAPPTSKRASPSPLSRSRTLWSPRPTKQSGRGKYLRGAEYYAEAAKLAPERVDYVLMRGHCLEDAGDFHGAYHAYADALAAAPSGDGHIQLGHLFKITGNLNEAELAYQRGARLGEPAAALELERLGSVSAAQFRLSAAAGVNALTVELFFELACCDRDDAFNHAAIVAAGKSLAAAGASDIAKAFFEIAYLGDDAGAFRQEHYGIVQRYPIWPTIHLSELVRASAVRAAQPPLTARARLKKLVAATLATLAGC